MRMLADGPPPHLPGFLNSLAGPLDHFGYWAVLWVGTWISLGYLVGNHIDAIYHDITRYSYYLLIALAVVLAAYIARHILRRTRRRTAPASRQAKASQAQDDVEDHRP